MSLLEAAIGWLAPAECIRCGVEGKFFCALCRQAEMLPHGERCGFCGALSASGRSCPRCRRQPGAPGHIYTSTDYAGPAQELLTVYKFGHARAAGREIVDILCDTLNHYLSSEELVAARFLIVPVPTATSRIRQRSFDHTALLAAETAKRLRAELAMPVGRRGQSRQVGARRSVRQSQLAGQFIVRRPDKIKGRHILLIDDVVTTGASLREVTKVLRQNGAKRVDALVFAKRL